MKKLELIQKILIGIIIILLISIGVYIFYTLKTKNNTKQNLDLKNTIDKYDYNLYTRDSNLFESYFRELKEVLNKEEVDYDKYAELITKLFVIDFYTLNNKISAYDIGSIQFIYDSFKENFILKSSDTIYKYIENNVNGKRNQELPIVKSVKLESIKNESYTYKDKVDDNAYIIELSWEYEEDLGYETTGTFVVIKENNKLHIVEKMEK